MAREGMAVAAGRETAAYFCACEEADAGTTTEKLAQPFASSASTSTAALWLALFDGGISVLLRGDRPRSDPATHPHVCTLTSAVYSHNMLDVLDLA